MLAATGFVQAADGLLIPIGHFWFGSDNNFVRVGTQLSKVLKLVLRCMTPSRDSLMLSLLLKVAGYRRSTPQRRSSRSKRWSRSAQTLFASWAVLGQLGAIGVLVGEALEPQLAKADINDIP